MRVGDKGRLVILSGPSGVGKDTLIDAWKALDPRVVRVIAYTTRDPRPGERNGIDYHFVSEEDFLRRIEADEFLEHKQVHGKRYATPLRDMEELLAADKIAVLKIDVQGALSVMALRPDAITVFIEPPSVEELERRIRGRAADSAEGIETRLENARAELALAGRYQHRIVNHDVGRAVDELVRITEEAK